MEDVEKRIIEIIEDVLQIDVREIPGKNLNDLARYAEAKRQGYNKNNYLNYKPRNGIEGLPDYLFEVTGQCTEAVFL